jgi:hypothetical protein
MTEPTDTGLEELKGVARELAYNVEDRERLIVEFMRVKDKHSIPNFQAKEILFTVLRERGLAERTAIKAIPDELKDKTRQAQGVKGAMAKKELAATFSANADKNQPEQPSIQETDLQQEKDFEEFAAKTYEAAPDDVRLIVTEDPRSEAIIQDEVNKSMKPTIDQNAITRIMQEKLDEIEQYKAKVKQLEETNKELTKDDLAVADLKSEIKHLKETNKDKEYIKLEQKLAELEETNQRLLNENKQYSEAVLKHGFETATNVKTDPQQIKNYEEMITLIEGMLKQKNAEIEALNQKIESYSHIDKVVDHQPLEFNVKPFIGVIFANRGNIVTLVHDGKKVLNIQGGGK